MYTIMYNTYFCLFKFGRLLTFDVLFTHTVKYLYFFMDQYVRYMCDMYIYIERVFEVYLDVFVIFKRNI